MSDKREPASGKKANPVPQGLDAAVRSQMVGYFRKALYLMGPLILAGLTGLGAMCWAYIEWRLPQIAGGVPKGAIVAFVQGNCPAKEGWTDFVRARSRVVIGSIPDTEDSGDAYPRRLQVLEQSGEMAEYVLTRATPHDSRQLAADELHVRVPGIIALTYCEKG